MEIDEARINRHIKPLIGTIAASGLRRAAGRVVAATNGEGEVSHAGERFRKAAEGLGAEVVPLRRG